MNLPNRFQTLFKSDLFRINIDGVVIAIGSVAFTGAFHYALTPYFDGQLRYMLFLLAVSVTTIRSGFFSGVICTLLSGAAAVLLHLKQIGPGAELNIAALILFLVEGLIFNILAERFRRNRGHAIEVDRRATSISKALESTESKLRHMVQSNIVGTLFYHRDGRILDCNDAFLNMLGYTREEFNSGQISWVSLTPPDVLEEDKRRLAKPRTSTGSLSFEKEYLHKDGHRVPVFIAASEMEPSSPEGVAFIVDLTEQKRTQRALALSEEKASIAASLAEIGMWEFLVREKDLVWASPHIYYLYGYEYGRTGNVADWASRVHPDDLHMLSKVFSPGHAGFEAEFRVVWPDGSTRWLATRGRSARDNANRIFGVTYDITAQKLAEEAIRKGEAQMEKSLREAQAANQMKDQFLATLSHELRTPLNAILGWSELIQTMDRNSELFKKATETIYRNAKLQCEMINDLLDLARILNGKFSIAVRDVDLTDIIMDSVESCRLSAQAKQINVSINIESEDTRVLGDPSRLQQILWNLLSNAIKFTPLAGEVRLNAKRIDSMLEIRVEDSGEGIEPEFLPYVFDRFRQADASTARKHGGLGLGLAIVRHLVELHGGTVHAESTGKNNGSHFQILLPIAPERPAAIQDGKVSANRRNADLSYTVRGDLKGKRILAVDDVKDSLELVGEILSSVGATVRMAGSAKEALSIFSNESFDVVVTDLGMPRQDGFYLLSEIRKIEREKSMQRHPVIAVTAYARESDLAKTKAAGFDAHIAKPVSPNSLYKTISSLAESEKRASDFSSQL